jgi:hypothetical protein
LKDNAPVVDGSTALAPSKGLSQTPFQPLVESSLVRLACSIISADQHCLFGPHEALFFQRVLPQLAVREPSVATAAAALGAAYETAVLKQSTNRITVDQLHLKAIHVLQNELASGAKQFLPLFLSSILLAASEVLCERRRNATVHIVSIFSILYPSVSEEDIECERLLAAVKEIELAGGKADSLDHLLLAFDTQIAAFKWAAPPYLRSRLQAGSRKYETGAEIIHQHPILIHACYHFIGSILEDRDAGLRYVATEAALQHQDNLVLALNEWLRAVAGLEQRRPPTNSNEDRYLAVLKAQAHMALVSVSTMLASSELAFDSYESNFRNIVSCAELALSNKTLLPSPNTAFPANLQPFSPIAGIVLPLSQTARKCRSPYLRRRAVFLLRHTGREGPQNGLFMAALASRVIEIEEKRPFTIDLPTDDTLKAGDIDERDRVCGCWRTSLFTAVENMFYFRFARPSKSATSVPGSGSARWGEEAHMDVWSEDISAIYQQFLTGFGASGMEHLIGREIPPMGRAVWRLMPGETL